MREFIDRGIQIFPFFIVFSLLVFSIYAIPNMPETKYGIFYSTLLNTWFIAILFDRLNIGKFDAPFGGKINIFTFFGGQAVLIAMMVISNTIASDLPQSALFNVPLSAENYKGSAIKAMIINGSVAVAENRFIGLLYGTFRLILFPFLGIFAELISMLLAAVIFALLHQNTYGVANQVALVSAAAVGFLYALIYKIRGSMYEADIAHIEWNIASTAMMFGFKII